MIARLLDSNATDFTVAGISLTDAISCKVTEERNGVFDLEMVVATTTPYYEELEVGKLIIAKPNHTQSLQAFEIYEITRPILQRVTVRAHHISYRQSFIPVKPFSCTGITETLQGLLTNAMESSSFTFTTDITNETSTYNQIAPASMRSRLGGVEGSVLDVFGGEYLWNNYETQLLLHRGADNGVELRVAKNITALEQTTNLESVVTGALPYWANEDETQFFYGDIQYNSAVTDYANHRTVVLDLSEEFETAPTVNQLNQAGQEYVNQVNLGLPNKNIKVSFIDLADTDEYSGSPLERINLCDTVSVIYTPLNISYKAKVIKLEFDVLAERTLSVEVGEARSTISKTITDLVGDVSSVVKTGKKLVSVTQKIDREVGSITSTVASVQEKIDGNEETGYVGLIEKVSSLQETDSQIESRVSATETKFNSYATKDDLTSATSTLSSSIKQSADDITLSINRIDNVVTQQGTKISDLQTYLKMTSRGLELGENGEDASGVVAILTSSELGFWDKANTKLAWLDSADGLGASGLSIGDATTAEKRWRVFTRQDGSHLTFTRHSS